MSYPWKHFWRHPYLVVCVAINYWLREHGYLPDKWYDKDAELLKAISK